MFSIYAHFAQHCSAHLSGCKNQIMVRCQVLKAKHPETVRLGAEGIPRKGLGID